MKRRITIVLVLFTGGFMIDLFNCSQHWKSQTSVQYSGGNIVLISMESIKAEFYESVQTDAIQPLLRRENSKKYFGSELTFESVESRNLVTDGSIGTLSILFDNGNSLFVKTYTGLFHVTTYVEYPNGHVVLVYNSDTSSAGWGDFEAIGADSSSVYFKETVFDFLQNLLFNQPAYKYWKYELESGTLVSIHS